MNSSQHINIHTRAASSPPAETVSILVFDPFNSGLTPDTQAPHFISDILLAHIREKTTKYDGFFLVTTSWLKSRDANHINLLKTINLQRNSPLDKEQTKDLFIYKFATNFQSHSGLICYGVSTIAGFSEMKYLEKEINLRGIPPMSEVRKNLKMSTEQMRNMQLLAIQSEAKDKFQPRQIEFHYLESKDALLKAVPSSKKNSGLHWNTYRHDVKVKKAPELQTLTPKPLTMKPQQESKQTEEKWGTKTSHNASNYPHFHAQVHPKSILKKPAEPKAAEEKSKPAISCVIL